MIENRGNDLNFHPKGRNAKILEYEMIGRQNNCLVEVKTMFGSKQDEKENDALQNLWESISEVNNNHKTALITITNYTSGQFDKVDFKQWLLEKLNEMKTNRKANGLVNYESKSGFKVTIELNRIKKHSKVNSVVYPLANGIAFKDETTSPALRVFKTVSHAARQLPNDDKPGFIIICTENGDPLFDEELRALLYGKRVIKEKFPLEEKIGAIFSPKQNTRISAVGVFYWALHKGMIFESMLRAYTSGITFLHSTFDIPRNISIQSNGCRPLAESNFTIS